MIEQTFQLKDRNSNARIITPIIQDENIHYMQMVCPVGTGLPVHFTNSMVYMTVNKGTLSISLSDGEFVEYASGTILKIPFMIKMDARNGGTDLLELLVVKAPAPTAEAVRA
jgi:quercetin dioxygenase-like cupin family protein